MKKGAQKTKLNPASGEAWNIARAGTAEILRATTLGELPWVAHAFSMRPGGQSELDGQRVLNLGYTAWDSRANVAANRRDFLAPLGADNSRLVLLRQIHSDIVHTVSAPPAAPGLRGDAAISATPGILLGIQTADCIPILLADTRRRVVGAVHAGWRGTLKRIAAKALGRMRMEFGTRPADVQVALGPGIGGCCYEVGPEVVQAFAAQFAAVRDWFAPGDSGPHTDAATFDAVLAGDAPNPLQWLRMTPPGHDPPPPRLRLDLAAANRWQLEDAGVPADQIVTSDLCTACRTDFFFSYRREHGRTGRMLSVIGIRS